MKSQVTTGHGDQGQTMALDGSHYSKAHPIMECTGCVDELRAWTALTRLEIVRSSARDSERHAAFLDWLANAYFALGAECSDPTNRRPTYHSKRVGPDQLKRLESEQAWLESQTQLPKSFISGASNTPAAHADILCTVARRLERAMVRLKEIEPAFQCENLLPFVNRLSDYCFMLARHLEDGQHRVVDYGSV
jgi:cob(I)alamin adenosyltransferase